MKRWITAAALATLTSLHTFAQEQPVLVVEGIAAGSAAAKAGLAVGDRIASADGTALRSPAALQALEEAQFAKPHVTLSVRRGDETLVVTAPRGPLGMRARPLLPAGTLPMYEDGRRAQAAGESDAVIARWSAAAVATRDAGGAAAAAWLYGLVGEIHQGERRWKHAIEAHSAAWTLLAPGGDPSAQSRTLMALGRCSESLGDFAGADQWYRQAEQVNRAANNELWLAAAVAGAGDVAFSRGDIARARAEHGRALGIRERLAPESLDLAGSFYSLGRVQWRSGDLRAAQDYAQRALEISERLAPESLAAFKTLSLLGILARERGDLTRAEGYYRRALALGERVAPLGLDTASVVNNLGDVARLRGDLSAAQEYFVRALGMRERLAPGSLDVANSFNNLGSVARDRGDLAAAEDFQKRALAIRERLLPDSMEVSFSLNNLGNVARDRGDLTAAESYHRRALAIKERLAPDSLDVASSLFNLGTVAESRRDLQASLEYHRRALALRERLTPDSLLVAQSRNSLGSVARDRGDVTTAETDLGRALSIRERLAPESLSVAETLGNIGALARTRGDLRLAQQHLTRALDIRERLAPNSLEVSKSLNLLGRIALDERRFPDALRHFGRAVDIVEARRWEIRTTDARALLLSENAESFAGLLRTYLALDDLPAAFAAAERGRARSLLEHLSEARAEIRQGVDPIVLQDERRLQRQINDKARQQMQLLAGRPAPEEAGRVKQELDALLVRYQGVQTEIRASSPRYAALTQPQPLGLAEIQRDVLDEGTLLLEYVLGDERSHLFAVTPTSINSFVLPARAAVEQAARRVYQSLIARQPVAGETAIRRRTRLDKADADYPAAASALSQMVLQPIAAELRGQRLLIVADGALQYIPFAALPRPGQTAAADAEPLVVKHEIVSLPSASIVSVLRRERVARQPAARAVAVVADPVFDLEDSRLRRRQRGTPSVPAGTPLPVDVTRAARTAGLTDDRGALARLAFTRDEADAIVALAPKGEVTRVVDFSASRATVTGPELGRYRIVHLATHGLLDAEHPELSGLVLSLVDEDGRPQDGFLRLHEVYNLSWAADLVVLSACQTALGKDIRGEGLVGLTRGFMYGGAERVIASLWNVNDSVTAQFMKRFYEGIFGKELTPAAALRAAQIDMWRRQSSRSPYYWAAFVLQGEWR